MFEGETNALCGANVAYATAIVSAYVGSVPGLGVNST